MDKLLQNFMAVLNQESRLVQDLIELGEKKRQSIVAGRVEELEKIVRKEGIVVSNLEKLEGARFQLEEQLADSWEIEFEQLSGCQVLEKLKAVCPYRADEMQEQLDLLRASLFRLRDINQENQELIQQSLEFIDLMQGFLIGEGAGIYSENGRQVEENHPPHLKRLVDKKA